MATGTMTALDPDIYNHNLAALLRQQPAIAALIDEAELPDHVEPAEGRDGSPTFRLEMSGGGRQWLGYSSMPTVSSPAMLAHFAHGSGNVLLPSIGHGGEAKHLLQKMARHQAVFTWDADAIVPTLALRLHDFSGAINQGRLVLALGPQPYEALLQCFEDYPTHLPPTTLFSAPYLGPADVLALQTQVEQAVEYQNDHLLQETARRSAELAGAGFVGRDGPERVLILSMVIDPEVTRVAESMKRCADRAGIECETHTVTRPALVHLLAATRCLQFAQPTMVILLNQTRHEWGDLLTPVRRCSVWFVSPRANPPEVVHGRSTDRLISVISRDLAKQVKPLQDHGCALRVLGPAADETSFFPLELSSEQRTEHGSDVAIIADAVDFSPDAVGLSWESHIELLEEIIRLINVDPRRLDLAAADQLIANATRRTHVRLDSAELRAEFSRFISTGIAPTLTVCSLLRLLRKERIDVKLWGSNWAQHDAASNARRHPQPSRQQRNMIYNAAKVVVHVRNDHCRALHLVEALAGEACILNQVQSDCAEPGDPAWEELLAAVPGFARLPQAVDLIRQLLADPEKRNSRMKAAHRLVRAEHLMGRRLRTLLE